jgi:hypothetical protein
MTFKFPYNKFPSHPTEAYPDNHIFVPTLDVKIVNRKNGKEIICHSLVDSGADFTCFHGLIGEAIGVEVEKGKKQPFSGVIKRGGIAFIHPLVIEVNGVGGEVLVGFSYELATPSRGFLGQRGFFELFKVGFNYPKRSFTLRFIG